MNWRRDPPEMKSSTARWRASRMKSATAPDASTSCCFSPPIFIFPPLESCGEDTKFGFRKGGTSGDSSLKEGDEVGW
jgi:hypothetical protein